jgi:hypothetical protein
MKPWTFAVLLLFAPSLGAAEVLGTATIVNGTSLFGSNHRVRPTLGYDIGNYATQRALFDDLWVDSTDVDSVLIATAASDTDFTAFAIRLGDGKSDYLCIGTCEDITCGVYCGREGQFFNVSTPDLGPATIEKVSLRINSLSFGRDSRGGQIVEYSFTVTVEGTRGRVPALPTSWGSLKNRYR